MTTEQLVENQYQYILKEEIDRLLETLSEQEMIDLFHITERQRSLTLQEIIHRIIYKGLEDKFAKLINILKIRSFTSFGKLDNYNQYDYYVKMFYTFLEEPNTEIKLEKNAKIISGPAAKKYLREKFKDCISEEIEWWLISKFTHIKSNTPNINGSYTLVSNGKAEYSRERKFVPDNRYFILSELEEFQPQTYDRLITFNQLIKRKHWLPLKLQEVYNILILQYGKNRLSIIPNNLFEYEHNNIHHKSLVPEEIIKDNYCLYLLCEIEVIENEQFKSLYNIKSKSQIIAEAREYNLLLRHKALKELLETFIKDCINKGEKLPNNKKETARRLKSLGIKEGLWSEDLSISSIERRLSDIDYSKCIKALSKLSKRV